MGSSRFSLLRISQSLKWDDDLLDGGCHSSLRLFFYLKELKKISEGNKFEKKKVRVFGNFSTFLKETKKIMKASVC